MKRLLTNMIYLGVVAFPLVLGACASKDGSMASAAQNRAVEVHVNQVALEKDGVKKAVVVSHPESKLARLSVMSLDGVFASEAVFEDVSGFSEWGAGKTYYKADFSSLRQGGTFYLEARMDDGSTARSPRFLVADNALFDITMADLLRYFVANRNTSERDRAIPIIDTGEKVDVYGGWNDAGGETGKYLSHLTYSNFFTPQQVSFVAWSMLAARENAGERFALLGLEEELVEEAFWGADFLHRMLSEDGYFYMTVFDRWGSDEDRWITGYVGLDGVYTPNYQAAFREGAGMAIAALASASRLAASSGGSGEFSGEQYLADAVRSFAHLVEHNADYCDDGKENFIDDYTALMAAVELYRATEEDVYLHHARGRAESLGKRLSAEGYFIADDGQRPYFHAVEAGLPVVSLLHYYTIESDESRRAAAMSVVRLALEYQLELDAEAPNPFDYPRQNFQTFDFEKQEYTSGVLSGFFIPHNNETGYWWQGENARLASLAAAAMLAGNHFAGSDEEELRSLATRLEVFAQDKFDWLMGKNPYGLCMLYGFGDRNPEFQASGGAMVKGGISNGITGRMESAEGRGIDWLAADEHGNWRWVEQWTPHGAWYLYASSVRAIR